MSKFTYTLHSSAVDDSNYIIVEFNGNQYELIIDVNDMDIPPEILNDLINDIGSKIDNRVIQ
jgi:hypothetical protein